MSNPMTVDEIKKDIDDKAKRALAEFKGYLVSKPLIDAIDKVRDRAIRTNEEKEIGSIFARHFNNFLSHIISLESVRDRLQHQIQKNGHNGTDAERELLRHVTERVEMLNKLYESVKQTGAKSVLDVQVSHTNTEHP